MRRRAYTRLPPVFRAIVYALSALIVLAVQVAIAEQATQFWA